jgi:hypothetical protein
MFQFWLVCGRLYGLGFGPLLCPILEPCERLQLHYPAKSGPQVLGSGWKHPSMYEELAEAAIRVERVSTKTDG